MKKEHLAIASVPCQSWEDLYEYERALKQGTIFPGLDKPFYVVEESTMDRVIGSSSSKTQNPEQKKREEVMNQINMVSFAINDLSLYLDTHKEDKNALQTLDTALKERKRLLSEFAAEFYPLTQMCMSDLPNETLFSWTEGPMPWEGACV